LRVAYVVPSNRTPQDGAAASLRDGLRWMQDWYRVQMDRNGFGPKTVVFETESDGVTPKIYTVRVQATDADLRRNLWGGTLSAAGDAGVPLFADGQDWLLVPECHVQSPDSTVSGGGSLGASAGTGFSTDGGVAVMGADLIPWLTPGALTDDQAYLGLHFPGLGPYPLGPAPLVRRHDRQPAQLRRPRRARPRTDPRHGAAARVRQRRQRPRQHHGQRVPRLPRARRTRSATAPTTGTSPTPRHSP
jgi:hypothetical protein